MQFPCRKHDTFISLVHLMETHTIPRYVIARLPCTTPYCTVSPGMVIYNYHSPLSHFIPPPEGSLRIRVHATSLKILTLDLKFISSLHSYTQYYLLKFSLRIQPQRAVYLVIHQSTKYTKSHHIMTKKKKQHIPAACSCTPPSEAPQGSDHVAHRDSGRSRTTGWATGKSKESLDSLGKSQAGSAPPTPRDWFRDE